MAIITKIDECGDKALTSPAGLQKSFYSEKLFQLSQHIAKEVGIVPRNIVPVKNYVSEYYPDADVDTLLLVALERLIDNSDDYIEHATLSNNAGSQGRVSHLPAYSEPHGDNSRSVAGQGRIQGTSRAPVNNGTQTQARGRASQPSVPEDL